MQQSQEEDINNNGITILQPQDFDDGEDRAEILSYDSQSLEGSNDFGQDENSEEQAIVTDINEYLYGLIENGLDSFHSTMWNQEVEDALFSILTDTKRIYFWVNGNRIMFQFDTLPELEEQLSENVQLLYIFRLDDEIIVPENVTKKIFSKQFIYANNLHNIIEDLGNDIIPSLLKDKTWPENIRKDLLIQTYKFVCQLMEVKSAREKKVQLYIPKENTAIFNQNTSNINQDYKEFSQRMEIVLLHWMKLIKDLLNSQQNQLDNDTNGIIEEVEFWQNCYENLINLKQQIQDNRVRQILQFLQNTNSGHNQAFEQLTQNILQNAEQAQSNLQFLKILEEPCLQLNISKPENMGAIFQQIMFCIRLLWDKCQYYRTEEKTAGLFKKVSNQIIRRCSSTINLDDLFQGNVNECIIALENSIQCLYQWREIYDTNVNAIKKEEGWQFQPETIFAQVEAFVQRCYDLKEICEGQIQFARRGIEGEMTMFTSTKGGNIVIMLDEIKANFEKLLLKLSGDNKDRVLDIKTTKWHEDYNMFKLGMKNLDNMYTNLITYAFDNSYTVQHTVEYMIGFKYIAKRDAISLHVSKKIEKVNELFNKELQNIEFLSKQPPSTLHYKGHFSGKCQWITGLLQRCQQMKQLYDKLYFIESFYKDQIEFEYNRIENQLKTIQSNCHKEFKESTKDIETTLTKRLDQNILIESMKKHGKNVITKQQAKEQGFKILIESNFDRSLLTFLHEMEVFKKLYSAGIPNYGGKMEEFYDGSREKLRVFRDNVLLVVRDYNNILNSITEFEQELFKEHIDGVNSSINRGLKILKWSTQGTLDNFVKECRTKCEAVSLKIQQFKKLQIDILKQIEITFTNIRFVHFDQRKALEFKQFLDLQDNCIQRAQQLIQQLFDFIKKNLLETYMNFIDKGQAVQKVWLKYVKNVDREIQEEFKKQFKSNFLELLKAVIGDEKQKTNPTQIFKFFIVLRQGDVDLKLDFEPILQEFNQEIHMSIKKSVHIAQEFKRLPHEMLALRAQKIEQIILQSQQEAKQQRLPIGMQVAKKHQGTYTEVPQEWISDTPPTYKECIEAEVLSLAQEITKSLHYQCGKLIHQLEPWKLNGGRLLNKVDYNEYINYILQRNVPVATLRSAVETYDSLQNDIQIEKTIDDSICIQVDTNKIKKRLIELNYEEQKQLLTNIKQRSIDELMALQKNFEENENLLSSVPTDLSSLRQSMEIQKQLFGQHQQTEQSLSPLEEKFKLLDDYMIVFSDEEMKYRQQIKQRFKQFYQYVEDIKKRNDGYYIMFSNDHMKRLSDFEQEVRDQKAKMLRELPIRDEQDLSVDVAINRLQIFKNYLQDVSENERKMEFGFQLFKINYVPIPEIEQIRTEIANAELFWGLRQKWDEQIQNHLETQFKRINTAKIHELCAQTLKQLYELPKQVQQYEISQTFLKQIESYSNISKLVELMRENFMRDRHWKQIKENIKDNFDQSEHSFNLQRLISINIEGISEFIREIHETAFSEYKIESALNDIVERWEHEKMEFEFLRFSNIKVISGKYSERLEQFLEEDLVQLSSLKSNAYAGSFHRIIETWDNELTRVSEVMDLLMYVQKKFVYFNNIFGNLTDDIGQLIGDKNIFNNVKINLLGYLNTFEQDKNTKKNLLSRNFKETLGELSYQLDLIQKHMRKYLEKRKYETPRFYFLSDEDIFELLGKIKDPNCLQKFLKKMFEGIKQLEYVTTQSQREKLIEYVRVVSEGEHLDFINSIEVTSNLNNTIQSIEKEVAEKLKQLLFFSLQAQASGAILQGHKGDKLEQWVQEYPGQILLLSGQIDWSQRCTQTFISSLLEDKNSKMVKKQLAVKDAWALTKQYYQRYINELVLLIRRNIDDLTKRKVIALITIEVHNKDLLDPISQVTVGSFEWLSQLRFNKRELENDKVMVEIEQGSGKFDYGFEYQGNNGRLIITPLTDRCYLSLTNALHFKRGGFLQGPTGTGKTETVKDLGKNLGRFVFVFNCSEELDVKNMKTMLEGLAMTGFWGCFDEFNRIEIEVLSVIAIQINAILEAISQEKKVFELEEKELLLNRNCALFVTMNPGYAGRSELPDNLKMLFRPFSMIVPDSVQICRITLQAEGFKTADTLSKKIQHFYSLLKQTLSNQEHYDWGLRTIKSVLSTGGELRRQYNLNSDKKGKENENLLEQKLLIQAVYSMTEPKLIQEDYVLFEGLLRDLFPENYSESKQDQNEAFIKIVDKVLDTRNLDKTSYFVEKLSQLYETKNIRHGTIVIGASMSGKTSLLECLENIQNLMLNKTRKYVLNPKSITVQQLYGNYNIKTDESTLGVFSSLMDYLCNKDDTPDEKWIIFDGPIDTQWIENMNSLLDDNKVLTLIDGNRINLLSNVKIIFEVDELHMASPATVSRCGIVFMDEKELTWKQIRTWWILDKDAKKVSDDVLDYLDDLFDKWVEPLMARKKTLQATELCPISENQQIRNFCTMFDSFAKKMHIDLQNLVFEGEENQLPLLEKTFVFCIIWTLGAHYNIQGKQIFDNMLRDIEPIMPFAQSVFDYYLSPEKGKFFLWSEKLSILPHQWKPPANQPINDFLVETMDTARLRFIITTLLEEKINVLTLGTSGVGKTTIMKALLRNMDENHYSYNMFNLTAGTTALKLQENIESKLNRTTKKKFRPYSGKRGFLFVDDVALPRKDQFGYQPTLELLRQMMGYGGWYDRTSPDLFVEIKDVSLVSAMREGQRLPQRLLGQLFVLGINQPSDAQLKRIYTSFLYYTLNDFDAEVIKSEIDNIVQFSIDVFKQIIQNEEFINSPMKPHYLFSMKDLTRIMMGISLIDKNNCDSKQTFQKLTLHENYRVYCDKMIEEKDRTAMFKIVNEQFDLLFESKLQDLFQKEIESQYFAFVKFLDPRGSYQLFQPSEEGEPLQELKNYLQQSLTSMNKDSCQSVNIVLFNEAIIQICKLTRALNTYNGNILLLGHNGTGKASLAKLSAYVNKLTINELRNPNHMQFRNSVKQAFETSIYKGEAFVFLFRDNLTMSTEVMEDINSLLSVGEIPNLFIKREGRDDFAKIKDKIKMDARKDSEETIYDYFLEILSKNMRCIFSTVCKSGLHQLVRNYTGLVYGTTQIYIENWPTMALGEVAYKFLDVIEETKKESTANFFSSVHSEVLLMGEQFSKESDSRLLITPKHFIDLGNVFQKIYEQKCSENQLNIQRYQTGLKRLEETQQSVEELKSSMDVKRIELHQKKKECEEMLFKIEYEKRESQKEKKIIEEKETLVTKEKNETQKLADAARLQLEKAEPILAEAENQVKDLDNSSIAEIKVLLKTKDKRLELIMFSLMIMLGEKPKWDTVQRVVTDPSFLKRIRDIEMDKIDEPVVQKLEQYTQQPEIQGSLLSYSKSVNTLAVYIRAVEVYVKVNLDVRPIRDNVSKLTKQLEAKEEEIRRLKTNLEETLARVEQLNQMYLSLSEEYAIFNKDFTLLEQRLERAERLVIGLSSSYESWIAYLNEYKQKSNLLLGNSLQVACFLNYYGSFNAEYRLKLTKMITQLLQKGGIIKANQNLNVIYFLEEEVEILNWNFKGLPSDQVSLENAVIAKHSLNHPFIIDPQNQCINWLKSIEQDQQMIICDRSTQKLQQIVEKIIIEGGTLLYQFMGEDLPQAIEYIIYNQIKRLSDGRVLINFVEKDIKMHPMFRFYMTTKNVHLMPKQESLSKLTIINFTVVQKGLEDQLLGVIIRTLDDKLEAQRIESIKTKSKCETSLRKLEKRVLDMLQAQTDVPLVDQIELIDTLQVQKEKEDEIKQTLETTKINFKKIMASRENYRSLGQISSLLFFSINQLERVNFVYQFSLELFLSEFEHILIKSRDKKTDFSDSLQDKIHKIDLLLRKRIYKVCSESLFEKDRLLLSFLLTINLLSLDRKFQGDKKVEEAKKKFIVAPRQSVENVQIEEMLKQKTQQEEFQQEYDFFLRSEMIQQANNQEPNPDATWINQRMWSLIGRLNTLPEFQGILGSFMHNTKEWKRLFMSSMPENELLPSDWSQKIKGFSILLLIKVIRPDRLGFAINTFVKQTLGPAFVQPHVFNLQKVVQRIRNKKKNQPILILVGKNVDPWVYIEQLAIKNKTVAHQISLGQGQLERAKEKIIKGYTEGFWVYLGNIHLSHQFVKEMDIILEYLEKESEHNPNFQLLLSSKPVDQLTFNLLQKSYKIVLEPVKGIKANMARIINNLLPQYTQIEEKDAVSEYMLYRKMVFGLCWLHTMVNERKRFRSLGWNVDYEFNDTDFVYSEKILREFIHNSVKNAELGFQWDAFNALLSEVTYGGRTTDQWDVRLLRVMVESVFNNQLVSQKGYNFTNSESLNFKNIFEMEQHAFQKSKNINYQALFSGLKTDFLKHLESFSEQEPPQIFGQHINAEVTMRIEDSQNFIDSMLLIERNMSIDVVFKSGGKTEIEAIVENIRQSLKPKINMQDLNDRIRKEGKDTQQQHINPITAFLIQEAKIYNGILVGIEMDLEMVTNCLKGKLLVNEETEQFINRIVDFKLPINWASYYPTHKNLIPWIEDLNRRVTQIQKMITSDSLLFYWLGGFIHPNGFLTALMQTYARKYNISIDNVQWDFSFAGHESLITTPSKEGAYITCLYLEGGKFDFSDNKLVEAGPMTLYYQMPVVLFKCQERTVKIQQRTSYYNCPCYIYQIREGSAEVPSFLFSIPLPYVQKENIDNNFWIKRGTAILLSIDN